MVKLKSRKRFLWEEISQQCVEAYPFKIKKQYAVIMIGCKEVEGWNLEL